MDQLEHVSIYPPEYKNCQRCGSSFECKVDDITNCQCYGIDLSVDELNFVSKQFVDCVCLKCLIEIRAEFQNQHSD